jgi:hypothetical protein
MRRLARIFDMNLALVLTNINRSSSKRAKSNAGFLVAHNGLKKINRCCERRLDLQFLFF